MSSKPADQKRRTNTGGEKKSKPHTGSNEGSDGFSVRKEPANKIVDRLLERVLSQTTEMKGSISDAIRLLQMKRELAGEQLKKIEVQWVEPSDAEPANSE